jgi:hypothetical protein
MNRIQFLLLNILGVIFILLVTVHFVSAHRLNYSQSQMIQAQQKISQANTCTNNLKQLALRVVQVEQKTMDVGLRDFMTRQQIVTHAPPSASPGAAAPGANSAPRVETPAPAAPDAPNPLDPPLNR